MGSNHKRVVKELREMLEAEGCTVLRVRVGKHVVVRARAPDGFEGSIAASISPSDVRTNLNKRTEIKHFARGIKRFK